MFSLKKSRNTVGYIMAILKYNEADAKVSELCREHGMSKATFGLLRMTRINKRYGLDCVFCIYGISKALAGTISESIVSTVSWG